MARTKQTCRRPRSRSASPERGLGSFSEKSPKVHPKVQRFAYEILFEYEEGTEVDNRFGDDEDEEGVRFTTYAEAKLAQWLRVGKYDREKLTADHRARGCYYDGRVYLHHEEDADGCGWWDHHRPTDAEVADLVAQREHLVSTGMCNRCLWPRELPERQLAAEKWDQNLCDRCYEHYHPKKKITDVEPWPSYSEAERLEMVKGLEQGELLLCAADIPNCMGEHPLCPCKDCNDFRYK